MSDWAGIKKAINSDLSKPLNTLIEESTDKILLDGSKGLYKNIYKKYLDLGDNSSNEITLLSISNAKGGQIHGLLFPNPKILKGNTFDFVIYIDGVDIFRVRYSYPNISGSGTTQKIAVIQQKNICIYSGYIWDKILLSSIGETNYADYKNIINSPFDSTSRNGASYCDIFVINKPIKFNNSAEIKIEAINCNIEHYNSDRGRICYELYN